MTSALGTGFVESRHAVPAAAVTVTIAHNPRPRIRTISRTRLGDITAHQGAGLAIARVRNADTEEVQAAPGGPVVAPRHGEGVLVCFPLHLQDAVELRPFRRVAAGGPSIPVSGDPRSRGARAPLHGPGAA